jgi:hypothetical protein
MDVNRSILEEHMPATTPRHSKEDLARIAMEILHTQIEPSLPPEDKGKFVAIDVNTGEFEIDANDYQAFAKLDARLPEAEMFLARAGYPTAYQMLGIR